ncbi:hypothetical protein [Qipengyuania sp. DGS5-3]|uniref:hypothetical protein n=1 Tax=Qipengyuania sp. DGS5-3 TaxID=3349632 RepID=UPI0036D20C16
MLTTTAAILLLQSTAAQGSTPVPAPAPPRCDTEEYAAFDFWVGEWDVYSTGGENQVSESRIERLYNGCAIRENWKPRSGATGGSLSGYDPATGRWHQTWIGSAPGIVRFDGGPADGKMVLTGFWRGVGGPGVDGLIRMTYTPNEDGSVRQHGEISTDHGLNWANAFDFTYRPKEDSE